jgi:hypothetical protein
MPVNPALFAGPNIGQLYQQARLGEQQAQGQEEDRQLRLGEMMARQQAQQAEAQREAGQQQVQTFSRLATAVRQRPYAERRAMIQSMAPQLQQLGISPEDIAAFDPTDQQLEAYIALGGAREQQPVALQREVEYLESLEPGLGRQMARNRAAGSPVLFDVTGDGVPDLVPREYFNNGQPQASPQRGAPAPPTAGQVVNGYRYRGGDPADRNSWEPVSQGGAGPSGPRNFR